MGKSLENLKIAITGDFGPIRTHEKIRRQIELAGGAFMPAINRDVTHLVASKQHYKNKALMGMLTCDFLSSFF